MNLADQKASLAKAYLAGERPVFKHVMPDGEDELWALGQTAIVVPVVPSDASPQLEYALRLRRDALSSGICPGCGATPSLSEAPFLAEIPMAAALFNHRVNCPGNDKNAKTLLAAHRKSHSGSINLEEKFHDLNKRARARIEPLKENGDRMGTPAGKALAQEILDARISGPARKPRCEHLEADPLQLWFTQIADGPWKCEQCWAYELEEVRRGKRLDDIEEFSCDLCRRYSPSTIQHLVLRIDNFIMHGGSCGRCATRYAASDGES